MPSDELSWARRIQARWGVDTTVLILSRYGIGQHCWQAKVWKLYSYISYILDPLCLTQNCSGLTSANHSDPYHHRSRGSWDRPHREGPAMATATLLNPAPHYQTQQPSYPSNYSRSAAGSNMPGIISPAEPRRRAEENEPQRQSLPSISEVISGTKPPTSAFPPSLSTSVQGAPSLPSPFTSSTSSRPFADLSPQDKHSSPRSLHNPASFPARSEPMPPFSDPSRAPLSSRPPALAPVNTFHPGARHSPPPLKIESHPAERQAEAHRLNGSYPPSAVEQQNLPYAQQGQLPPGQLPLSAHPMSPRYPGHSLPSPFDGSRSSMHEDSEYMRRENKYEQTLSRHFEAWQYQESLAKVWSIAP